MNNKFTTLNPQDLHNQLTSLVKTERRIMHEVLRCIYQIDQRKAFAELGYGSLFEYLVKGQGYSETSALNRMNGMRLLKEVPEVANKLQKGTLNLSQLHKFKVAINQEQKLTGVKVPIQKKKMILEKIETCTLQETEKVLTAELNYKPLPREKVLERKEDVYLTLKLSQTQFKKLKKAQILLSHVNIDNNYANLLEVMSEFIIKKKLGKKEALKQSIQISESEKDPVAGLTKSKITAVESLETNEKNPKEAVMTQTRKNLRQFIPVQTKQEIHQTANYSCEFVSPITGKRCCSTYQLQIDHKVPIAKGGQSHVKNLRLLCRTHNLSEAQRWGLRPKNFADTGFLIPPPIRR